MALFCLLCALPGEAPAQSLEERLAPLAKAHKGKVAIAVRHLGTGEGYALNADVPMPTASLIKLPVLVETYLQAREGKVKLDDMLTLTKENMVPGSGILTQHFSPGAMFCLRDAARLMIVYSDNTATNMVLDRIGLASTNARMEALGFPNTRINAKVFLGSKTSLDPARTKEFGLGSTTAGEMVALLEMLHKGEVGDRKTSDAVIEVLKRCDDTQKFPRLLPKGVVIAHKTGSVNAARTDAGILTFKGGPVTLCVLTDENEDRSWGDSNAGDVLCAKVAKEVFDHFSTKARPSGK